VLLPPDTLPAIPASPALPLAEPALPALAPPAPLAFPALPELEPAAPLALPPLPAPAPPPETPALPPLPADPPSVAGFSSPEQAETESTQSTPRARNLVMGLTPSLTRRDPPSKTNSSLPDRESSITVHAIELILVVSASSLSPAEMAKLLAWRTKRRA
jgi:hypothetical protein